MAELPDPNVSGGVPPLSPEPRPFPWRDVLGWVLAIFTVAWGAVLLPGVVRHYTRVEQSKEAEQALPEMPDDPELKPEVKALLAEGRRAEQSGQLAAARRYYWRAGQLQPKCFSCILRRHVVERLIDELVIEALSNGNRYLGEARWEEAATEFRKVLALVPDKKAEYHITAQSSLTEAQTRAKASGRPIP